MHVMNTYRRVLLPLAVYIIVLGSSALRAADSAAALTLVSGGTRKQITAAELAALPQIETEVEHHGKKHRCTGVDPAAVFSAVGVRLGKGAPMRAILSSAVRVTAADGYTVVFALADFEKSISKQNPVLAIRQDGAPLPDKTGPFQLILDQDKCGKRCVRQISTIEVIPLAPAP
jgi:hypothetical protein